MVHIVFLMDTRVICISCTVPYPLFAYNFVYM